jgi:hypothetical protein
MTTGTPTAVCVVPQLPPAVAEPGDEEHPVSTAAVTAAAPHSSDQVRLTRSP